MNTLEAYRDHLGEMAAVQLRWTARELPTQLLTRTLSVLGWDQQTHMAPKGALPDSASPGIEVRCYTESAKRCSGRAAPTGARRMKTRGWS